MPLLRVRADKNRGPDLGKEIEEAPPPQRRAFLARRPVAALGVMARKAEAHRHDRDLRRIVENLGTDPEPIAQAVAGGVGERAPAFMNACARRLTENFKARGRRS